ncbi:MAG: PD-(D/E)XK nuclease family protein [Bacteroidetes bacterium]|nr:PD-(D/E)XK nuclease family protein [Bacteroidota bacterium]
MDSNATFLQDLIITLEKGKIEWSETTLVFPNKRAGLFFRKYLSRHVQGSLLSPQVYSLEEFVLSFSDSIQADQLSLIFDLFEVYKKMNPHAESFDRFHYWGEMLLRDFEDIDQHLVEPRQIFRGVKDQKELEENFRFLDPQHLKVIQSFWASFLPKASSQQVQFLKLWEVLYQIYEQFLEKLKSRNEGYKGMLYREVLTFLDLKVKSWQKGQLVFAGFNALTKVEEEIIRYFEKESNAQIFWDYDDYYLNDEKQEAGDFLRKYRDDKVLGKSFGKMASQFLTGEQKEVSAIGVPLKIGQAKVTGKLLTEEAGLNDEKTVIVLADEGLLFPVLNSIPPSVSSINVTMGFPLKNTPLFSLLQSLLELQQNVKQSSNGTYFYYRHVLALLRHPYIFEDFGEESTRIGDLIEKYNKVYVGAQWLNNFNPFFGEIFKKIDEDSLSTYIEDLLLKVIKKEDGNLENEYIHHFLKQLRRLSDLVSSRKIKLEMDVFLKLFRQIIQSIRLPFSGEPLRGLQIMGILETRNLDFENVIVLSMNEGSWPAENRASSFIPFNIRKAFELPTFDQQESIYAYLFYRLMQRSKRVWFLYNTEEDFNMNGEISRFVRQLELESGFKVKHKLQTIPVHVCPPEAITVKKDSQVLEVLKSFTTAIPEPKRLTPSALSIYLDCRLKFYFRYIAKLYEPEEVKEEIDPGSFGNILHLTMELLYGNFTEEKGHNHVGKEDIAELRKQLPEIVEHAFRKHYGLVSEQDFKFEGRNLIARAIILKFANAILDKDNAYASFDVIGLEAGEREGFSFELPIDLTTQVALKGIIDRIDLKDGIVRVIDYKTGKDEKNGEDIPSLFDRDDKKRNKAAMQVLYYAFMFHKRYPEMDYPIVPGIFNSRELFADEFDVKLKMLADNGRYAQIWDARPLLAEFESGLTDLLSEIFNPAIDFDQTEDVKKCRWCPYKGICHRG